MTLLEQGQKLLSEKKYDDALKCFDGVLKGDPGNVEALLGKIAVFRETQNFSQANELLDEVLEGDPGNAEALQGKIAILREKHEFRQANELLRDALTRHPNHAGILSEQAWLLLAQKKYDEAIDAFSKVLQIRPDLGIYMWKAALLRGRRRFDEAERTLDEANEHFNHVPQIARIQSERGWLHFYRKRYDEALAVFTSVVTNARYALADQESALQGEIASLRMKGLYADAMRSADKSLKMMSMSPGIHSERGWIHFDQADYESAEKDFQVVLDLAPNDVSSHTNLALSLVRQGGGTELHRATEHFRIALQYDPNSAEALGGLGTIAFKQRRVREAETYFRRSIEADPEKGLYADLAALYIQMGRYDEARKELEEGVRRNPDDAIVHIELGNLHLQNSESKEATREFRSATMLDPYNPRPIIGLAVTLMESNKLSEAETVLRRGFDSSTNLSDGSFI
jgi:tetratricopeptide (TPR) repeat protein